MKNDIGEAIAADELLYVIEHHVNSWDDPPEKLEPGLQFMVDALALRMALAINRLFQPAGQDRTNFSQLKNLVATNTAVDPNIENAFTKAATLAASDNLVRLKPCRDGFMAHTLVGSLGNRHGMQFSTISDALQNAEELFEELHSALTGSTAGLTEVRTRWRQRAAEFWQDRLPQSAPTRGNVGKED